MERLNFRILFFLKLPDSNYTWKLGFDQIADFFLLFKHYAGCHIQTIVRQRNSIHVELVFSLHVKQEQTLKLNCRMQDPTGWPSYIPSFHQWWCVIRLGVGVVRRMVAQAQKSYLHRRVDRWAEAFSNDITASFDKQSSIDLIFLSYFNRFKQIEYVDQLFLCFFSLQFISSQWYHQDGETFVYRFLSAGISVSNKQDDALFMMDAWMCSWWNLWQYLSDYLFCVNTKWWPDK